ncbi:MAG: FkbM family methyltransferase, partial [bacterium]|nr:FkbM family methyltransferase [bacterium]
LNEQIALNKLQARIQVDARVVGAAQNAVFFSEGRGMNNQVISEGGKQKEQVVLDQLLEKEHPALMKVDVEGFEQAVFMGMRQVLQKSSLMALIVELDGKGAEEKEKWVLDLLISEGFEAYQYEVGTRSLVQAGQLHTGNFLFIRDPEAVQEKLRQAKSFSFFEKSL